MITREQLALIHVARKELQLTDERYREILLEQGGVESSKDLSGDGVSRVMNTFVALGFKPSRKFSPYTPPPRNAADLPTVEQLTKIKSLWTALARYIPAALSNNFQRGFMSQRLRLPALGPQTRGQANKLIEALKNRVAQEAKKCQSSRADPAA